MPKRTDIKTIGERGQSEFPGDLIHPFQTLGRGISLWPLFRETFGRLDERRADPGFVRASNPKSTLSIHFTINLRAISMRVLPVFVALLFAVPVVRGVSAAEMAVPASVKDVAKLRPGLMVQVRGYVRLTPKGGYELESPDNGRKVALDFSRSTVSPEANGLDKAGGGSAIAIELVGRVDSGKEAGSLAVIGYSRLTP